MSCKRELLFFIKNYTGHNNDIKEMSHPKKHARTYMNRFTINEDDQFEISKIEEMDSDWEYKEGPHPKNIHNRIHQLVGEITAENLDIFLFGWYEFDEFDSRTLHHFFEDKPYKKRINIYNTLTKGLFHLKPTMNNSKKTKYSSGTLKVLKCN